tara:strand:+ start:1718 stop:2089 length:372 start_codon:yes stop_codon:yes gene_type:complete
MSNIYTQGGTTPKKRLAMAKDKTGDSYIRTAKATKSKPSITPTSQDTSLKSVFGRGSLKYKERKEDKDNKDKRKRERDKTPFEEIINKLFIKENKKKKGGRIGKSKSRRRITLRGWGKALRGY